MTNSELISILTRLPGEAEVNLSYTYWERGGDSYTAWDVQRCEPLTTIGSVEQRGKRIVVLSTSYRDLSIPDHEGYSDSRITYQK